MLVEAIVKGVSLENMGPHVQSTFVLTIEILGSNGTELRVPIDRSHAFNYQLGQKVRYSIEALDQKFYIDRGPENYDLIDQPDISMPEEPDDEKNDDYDDYDDHDSEETEQTIESVLDDKSDEMSDEEIARKVGKTEESKNEPTIAPKVENTEIKSLTESEYQEQKDTKTTTEALVTSETNKSQTVSDHQEATTDSLPRENQTYKDETADKSESEAVKPIGGMMGGYPDSEDVYDDDDEDEE